MVGGCPGTLASSTTKIGRHDIAEILLKVALKLLKTFIGTYIPDFNSIPLAVLEKKFLENRPIRIFKVTWWLCFLTNLHKSNNPLISQVGQLEL
jgi:hypothetical protein